MPRLRHVRVRFSIFPITVEVVTVCKKEVEGAETHEMGILGPHTNSVTSSLQSMSTGQDINDEAQSVNSQAEGVTSIWPCSRIPRRSFCSVTGSRRSDAHEVNIDQSRNSDDVGSTTSDILAQAEAQTCACFHTIVGISMTWLLQNQPRLVSQLSTLVLASPSQTSHLNKT